MDGRRWRIGFCVLVVAMALGSVNWSLLTLPFANLEALREVVARIPDRASPEYPQFLDGVRARTPAGATIAIEAPQRWHSGYEYAYYRASYFLTARTVVPLLDENDVMHRERLRDVEYLAAWQMPAGAAGFTEVWRGNGGVLARRAR